MKGRKQAKIITNEEFLSGRDDISSCDIENVLCGDYVYLLDSMDMEDFEYDDTSFDIFKEIVYENKVVGFVSYMQEENHLLLMEMYVMPEYRNNNLLCREISSNDNVMINMPKTSLVKSLIKCNLACELSDGIVVSEIPFSVSSYDLNGDVEASEYYCHVYDLNNASVLLLEDPSCFNYSRPTRSDKKKHGLKCDIDDEYLSKAREIVCKNNEKYLKVSSGKFRPKVVFLI